jgi:hemerythrin-like domain-containing protein
MEPSQDPIEFILEEHDRQLEVCVRLEDLVSASDSDPKAHWAASLLEYLTKDLPIHIEDEERDLFPLLASRQEHDQDLPVILDQLMSEHELDRGLIEPIVEDLRHIAEGSVLVDSGRFCMYVRTFTVAMRRHLNWENRVVLPLARRVLSKEDRALLRDGIADRRRCLSPGGS